MIILVPAEHLKCFNIATVTSPYGKEGIVGPNSATGNDMIHKSGTIPSKKTLPPQLPGPSYYRSPSLESGTIESGTSSLVEKVAPLTSKLGLPPQAIKRIAEKASELIATDGAIVNAPGYSVEAKMVKSHSGRRLHLVTPKKKGAGFVCDDECPQYKSAKLCSHILATAVVNERLDSFIGSYASVKKLPNLTKLATSGMPKGRWRKGTKAPSKRRPSVPVQSQIPLNTPSDSSIPPVQVRVSSSSNTSVAISPFAQSHSIGGTIQVGVSNTPVTPFAQSEHLSTASSESSPTFHTPQMPTWCPPTFPHLSQGDPTNGGLYPFRVHVISGNIAVCHGCKCRYQKLGPPHDLCLQHEEWRTFTPCGSMPQSRFGNVYYHCSVNCVMSVWPQFIPCSVVVPPDL